MTHVTCRLTAKNRDQLRNPTLGNRVWAAFTFLRGFSCRRITQHPSIRQPGFDLPRHTWSLMNRFRPCRANLHKRGVAQSLPVIVAIDRQWISHCRHVPINEIWRWTESTPRSGRWRSHIAGIHSECSTREIIITIIIINRANSCTATVIVLTNHRRRAELTIINHSHT